MANSGRKKKSIKFKFAAKNDHVVISVSSKKREDIFGPLGKFIFVFLCK